MASQFTGAVLKRHRPQENLDRKLNKKKRERCISNTPTDSFEDKSVANINRKPTAYHNLLASLGLSNKVVSDMNRRRQRQEQGKSDTEEDEDEENSSSEDISSTDGDDDEIQVKGADLECLEQEKIDDNHSDEEDSETDEENELSTNGQSSVVASSSTSAFSEHLGHTLLSEEVKTLLKHVWSFKWKAPAIGMPNCSWKGTRQNFLDVAKSDAPYGIKPKLFEHWLQLYKEAGGEEFGSSARRRFFSICNSYMDILHSNKKPFYNGDRGEDSSHIDAYLMHSLNHIFRSRDLVKKNERKIAKLSHGETPDDRFRDRGFTSPKVLILLPLRSIAFRVVNRLIQLTPEAHRDTVEHHGRFNDEFGYEDESDDFDDGKPSKPRDWEALFGEGNNDDTFLLGIKYTRKSIRLYNDFITSDMIIASPLGLVLALGKAEDNKKAVLDYLSSIEVFVIDHADVMYMQNWTHVQTVVTKLNEESSEHHNTDISRVRPMYLNGHARFYRQSIILSSYLTPDINFLFNHQCLNYKGKMKLECEHKGVLHEVLHSVTQIYEKFDADSVKQADHARLEYFTKKIFPKLKDSVQGGVMIFMSSNAELAMLREFLSSQKASFCIVNESVSQEAKSRARQGFFAGSTKIMLYNERGHFYWRYTIRGIKKLIIYSLPERKEFYPQIVNMLEESYDMEATVLFCPLDVFRLRRIVGHASAKSLLSSERSTFIFR
ncbi:hypothetical protein Rs2_02138 [Raphanus sativus]|uniref:Protein NUCLEOLAR FACTOR 1-like n=1 Tax=Raphanus sativus TaxID=3726 RepID=A0A6J0P550_RAPSA|nr:protein NUCLEOLAR FACTOR 1-like [Raphanus sativus]KAJ4916588.1 hypothetical protein Rs2_02138 [Raphanus sativus]